MLICAESQSARGFYSFFPQLDLVFSPKVKSSVFFLFVFLNNYSDI